MTWRHISSTWCGRGINHGPVSPTPGTNLTCRIYGSEKSWKRKDFNYSKTQYCLLLFFAAKSWREFTRVFAVPMRSKNLKFPMNKRINVPLHIIAAGVIGTWAQKTKWVCGDISWYGRPNIWNLSWTYCDTENGPYLTSQGHLNGPYLTSQGHVES